MCPRVGENDVVWPSSDGKAQGSTDVVEALVAVGNTLKSAAERMTVVHKARRADLCLASAYQAMARDSRSTVANDVYAPTWRFLWFRQPLSVEEVSTKESIAPLEYGLIMYNLMT